MHSGRVEKIGELTARSAASLPACLPAWHAATHDLPLGRAIHRPCTFTMDDSSRSDGGTSPRVHDGAVRARQSWLHARVIGRASMAVGRLIRHQSTCNLASALPRATVARNLGPKPDSRNTRTIARDLTNDPGAPRAGPGGSSAAHSHHDAIQSFSVVSALVLGFSVSALVAVACELNEEMVAARVTICVFCVIMAASTAISGYSTVFFTMEAYYIKRLSDDDVSEVSVVTFLKFTATGRKFARLFAVMALAMDMLAIGLLLWDFLPHAYSVAVLASLGFGAAMVLTTMRQMRKLTTFCLGLQFQDPGDPDGPPEGFKSSDRKESPGYLYFPRRFNRMSTFTSQGSRRDQGQPPFLHRKHHHASSQSSVQSQPDSHPSWVQDDDDPKQESTAGGGTSCASVAHGRAGDVDGAASSSSPPEESPWGKSNSSASKSAADML